VTNSFSSKGDRPYQPRKIAKWLRRDAHHPDSFQCGVRVIDGDVDGEGSRWKYRQSSADRLIIDAVVALTHGAGHVLRVRVDPNWTPHPDQTGDRVGYVIIRAVEETSGASVEIAVSQDELERFGIAPV
jgi:hypothetical protein